MTTTEPAALAADTLAGRRGMFVTSTDAAAVLGISRGALERLALAGTSPVPPTRHGRSVRWSVNALRGYCGLPPLDPAAVVLVEVEA